MVQKFFYETVSALVEALIMDISGKRNSSITAKCTEFVVREVGMMQPLLRIAVTLLMGYMNYAQIFRHGEPLTGMPLDARVGVIKAWAKSRFSFKNDFLKMMLTFTILAYFDTDEVLDEAGIDVREYSRISRFYNNGINDV